MTKNNTLEHEFYLIAEHYKIKKVWEATTDYYFTKWAKNNPIIPALIKEQAKKQAKREVMGMYYNDKESFYNLYKTLE